MNRIFKRKLVFVKVCSPFSFIRFANAEKIWKKKTSAWAYRESAFHKPAFHKSAFHKSSFYKSSPVQSSKYSMPNR